MDSEFLDNKRQVKVKFLKAINCYMTEFSISLLFVQKKCSDLLIVNEQTTDRFAIGRFLGKRTLSLMTSLCHIS